MLREQRLALINGGVLEESTIEQLYYESMNAFDDVDFYTESVGDAVETAFEKLGGLIDKILTAIKNFFAKFRKDSKNMEINPDVEVNEKELNKLQKFLKACKKVIIMPVKKLGKMLKDHKKGAIVGAVITAITAFSIGAIVTKKKNDKIRENNTKIRKINEDNKNMLTAKFDNEKLKRTEEYIKINTKKEQELSKTLQETENLCHELETRITKIKNSNKSELRSRVMNQALKNKKAHAESLRSKISDVHGQIEDATDYQRGLTGSAKIHPLRYRAIPDYEVDAYLELDKKIDSLYIYELPLIQNFYTVLAGKLSKTSNALQSGLTKMRRPKRS